MSDQEAEQTSGETGSLNAGISHQADAPSTHATASATESDVAADAVASEPAMAGPATSEPSISEPVAAPKIEAMKAEASAAATEAASEKISPALNRVIVMPRGDRAWADHGIHAESRSASHESLFGKRRIAAIAAVAALATVAGALGGGFATATFMHGGNDVAATAAGNQPTLEASLSRIDTDVQALKAGLEHTSKVGMSQFNKTSDRLDKLERAQAEPTAKLAKLSEAVDKLRVAPAPAVTAATAVASKETTGSITPGQQAAATPGASKPDAKTEIGRLPTLDDWVLRDVAYGGALIDGRHGVYEVYAGDVVPGLGRVDAIRRQDGRWVVVTSRGLIVAR